MHRAALFSPCQLYRYELHRVWDDRRPAVLFVGLNPSTADAEQDDPTVRVCMGYARRWGFGGLILANLFAWRATAPTALRHAPDPVGPDNDAALRHLATGAPLVVCAWGDGGGFQDRDRVVLPWLPQPHCLARLKSGRPGHPLYKRRGLRPKPLSVLEIGGPPVATA